MGLATLEGIAAVVAVATTTKYQAPISAFVCPAPGTASSLRMASAAFTLRAAYVHSYAMPVFMYHLCGVLAEKSRAFGWRRPAPSRMARCFCLLSLEHDTFDVSQNTRDFLSKQID